jgi:CRP-like cAMP-binding protein
VLNCFAEETQARLRPLLVPLELQVGAVLQVADQPVRHVYFPQDAVVAQFHETSPGTDMALLLLGRGSLVGAGGVLAGGPAGHVAMVVRPGRVLRLGKTQLRDEMDRDAATRQAVLQQVQALIAQTAQAALCSRFHSVEQQLCLRLAQLFGQGPPHELALTQELLARIVGARRERVNQVIGDLQAAGVLESGRGWLRVLDGPALRQRACNCAQTLLPPGIDGNRLQKM